MRNSILVILLLASYANGYGQTYQKLYTDNRTTGALSGGLVANSYNNNTAFYLKGSLNIADSIGNIIVSTPMNVNPSQMLWTLDHGYVFASKGSLGYSSLIKSDSVGNILWQVKLPDNSTNILLMRLDNAGNTYLLADSSVNQNHFFLQKYDINGNLLWSKEVDNNLGAFAVNSTGDILLAGISYSKELNTNGDSVWQQNYTHPVNIYPFDVVALSAGGFISLGVNVSGTYFTCELYEISSTGALVDSMLLPGSFSSTSIFKLRISADGSIILYSTSASAGTAPYASLIDISPFGQVNWQRSFLGDGNYETAFDICPLPNGFILSGDTASPNINTGIYSNYGNNYSAVFIDRLNLAAQYQGATILDSSFSTYSTSGIIDTNYIAASVSEDGNLFSPEGFRVPKSGSASAIYDANIWVAGQNNGNLYNSSETYTSQYEAGPGGTLPQDANKWNNIWLISRADVLAVKSDFDTHHAITQPVPASVLAWPAKGNGSAAGNGGAPLTVDQDMAPFYDRNGDGVYNVYDGDYPKMRGDQMLWWVNNDVGSQSQNPMGIDRRYSLYEYNCTGDTNLSNTLFLSVSIKNQSNRAYDSVTIGTFVDFSLGCYNDNRIGSIPSQNSFYVYKGYVQGATQLNGVTCDEGSVCPTSETGYGCNLPIFSATFLNDTMKCFGYISPGAGFTLSYPTVDQGYYQYMNGEWVDGSPITYGGDGYGGTTPYPFVFPGNPADTSQWSEINTHSGYNTAIAAGDRITVAAIGPFSLLAGDTINFDMAFIFHRDSFNNVPDISDSSIVEQHIDSISRYYASESFPCWFDSSKVLTPGFYNVGIHEIPSGAIFSVVPNPNKGNFIVHLSAPGSGTYALTVSDMLGRVVYYNAEAAAPDQTVSMAGAASGVYSVTIETQNSKATKKVVITSP